MPCLEAGVPRIEEVPDRGSVREDLLALCRQMRRAKYSRSGFTLRSVVHECASETVQRFHDVIFGGVVRPGVKLIRGTVQRGIERGEVWSGAANAYVADVIPALMMHRSKVCGSEGSERDLEEMTDQAMVPLLRMEHR